MEELAAFAAAGGDQTASSSSGYSSDGSADSSWEPDPDDASSAENEDEREEDQGGGEDMDTSIILIDCDLTSEVTRLIREDVCTKRCLEGKAAKLEQFLCSLSQMTGGERKQSIMTALAVLKETDTVQRHRGTGVRDQYHYYLPLVGHVCRAAWCAAYGVSTPTVTRFRNRINNGIFSVKAHGNRLNQNTSAVDLLVQGLREERGGGGARPAYFTWGQLYMEMHNYVEEIRLRGSVQQDLSSASEDHAVLIIDYSQNLTLPSVTSTPSQWYFLSLRSVNMFGIYYANKTIQYNYIYDETVAGKGTDEVNSLLHHFIHKIVLPGGHRKLTIYADNCGGQNKNNYVLKALLALAHMGDLKTVELKFFVKGHTKNAVDRGFGHVRKRLSRVDVWTMDRLLEAVNDASATSALVHVPNKNNTIREYREVVKEAYKDLKDIQKFQIFVMKSDSPGVVACQRGPRSSPVFQDLGGKYDGIVVDADRQLYNKVRPYVPEEFVNDALYAPPNDEDERKANEIKRARAARQKASAKRKKLEREAATKRDPLSEAAGNSAGNEAEAMQTEQQPAEGDRSGRDEASMAKEPSHVKKRPRKETS
uniref:DUF7869 domain-containing protein n=1 Tax=Phytophthora ramorum TaxID=164328 RepID=H3H4Y9_PHYRM